MPDAAFVALNAHLASKGAEPMKNPRNATGGTLKQLALLWFFRVGRGHEIEGEVAAREAMSPGRPRHIGAGECGVLHVLGRALHAMRCRGQFACSRGLAPLILTQSWYTIEVWQMSFAGFS